MLGCPQVRPPMSGCHQIRPPSGLEARPPGFPILFGGLGHCIGISPGVSNCPQLSQVGRIYNS